MDYYLNEYSLRGQFNSVDEFFSSLQTKTLPVLKKIESEKESIVWKKDTFWQSEICNGVTLLNIPKRKNERSPYLTVLRNKLMKLTCEEPFWENDVKTDLKISMYKFDETYREHFEKVNCFIKALEADGKIISFFHPNYNQALLPVVAIINNDEVEYCIDNIVDESWWEIRPQINTWNHLGKYTIEVRANEFEYHPPHFHVSYNEYQAVFKLSNGEVYKDGKKKWTSKMITEIQMWYQTNKDELQTAWRILHKNGNS